MTVISAFDCLAMRDLSFTAQSEFQNYGLEKLDVLIDHYGEEKGDIYCKPLIDGSKVREEYGLLKQLVLDQKYPRDRFHVLWKTIYQKHKDVLPNLIDLVRSALTIPLQTAVCERGFSVQNVVETAHRNRLS